MRKLDLLQLLRVLPIDGFDTFEREIAEDCKQFVYPQLENNHAVVQRVHYLELEHPLEDLPNLFLAVRAEHIKAEGKYFKNVIEYIQFDDKPEQLEHMHRETLVNPTEQTKFLSN